jgi:hypothetical protein
LPFYADGSQQFASSGSLPSAPLYQSTDQGIQQGVTGMEHQQLQQDQPPGPPSQHQHPHHQQQQQQHYTSTQDQQYGYHQQYGQQAGQLASEHDIDLVIGTDKFAYASTYVPQHSHNRIPSQVADAPGNEHVRSLLFAPARDTGSKLPASKSTMFHHMNSNFCAFQT